MSMDMHTLEDIVSDGERAIVYVKGDIMITWNHSLYLQAWKKSKIVRGAFFNEVEACCLSDKPRDIDQVTQCAKKFYTQYGAFVNY